MTPLVEPIALDEAFLDVSGARRLLGSGEEIAAEIRTRVHDEIGLTCSVGVAPNKLLAKLASEAAKPIAAVSGVRAGKGIVVIDAEHAEDFLYAHPIRALWGVGPRTYERLAALGVQTVADLAKIPLDALVGAVGMSHGNHLHELSLGRDQRPVVSERDTKSIGHEETFVRDIDDTVELHRVIVRLCDAVASRLRASNLAARTVQLKLRFADFTTITRSRSTKDELSTGNGLARVAGELLDAPELAEGIRDQGIRLLGVSASHLAPPTGLQLSFDDLLAGTERGAPEGSIGSGWHEVADAIDAIRERFGADAVVPGASMSPTGDRDRTVGADLWGPSDSEDEAGAHSRSRRGR